MPIRWVTGLLAAWTCLAQAPPKTPAQLEAALEAELKGDGSRPAIANAENRQLFPELPNDIQPPAPSERPSGQSISVSELQHRVPKKARQLLARALKLSQAGDHPHAAAELEAAVLRDPEFAGAYNQLGVEYGHLGRFDEAKTALRRSIEVDPASWGAHYNLAVVLLQTGDPAEAGRSLRRALEDAPENARAHWLLGRLLYQSGETRTEALQHLEFAARTMREARDFLQNVRTP